MKLHTRYGFSSVLLENMLFLETSSIENKETCTLLGSWFGVFIQFALGLVSFLTLLVKLYNEKPRRPFGVWARDSSKQAFGALLAHGFNILFAGLLTVGSQNPCVFYFVNFAVDTVFGLILNYVFLITFDALAATMGWTWFQSGNYGYPPRWAIWAVQFIEWLIIVTVVKFILLYALVIPFRMPFYDAGVWLMQPFENYPKMELVMVMVIIPFVLNTIVFWIQDNILMDRTHSPDVMYAHDTHTHAYFSSLSSSKSHPFIDHYTQSNPKAQRTVLSKVGTNPMKQSKKWYQLFETTPEEEAEYYHYHGEPQFPYPRQSKNGERGTMISDHDIEHPSSEDDPYEHKYEQPQQQHIVSISSQTKEITSSGIPKSPKSKGSFKNKGNKVKKIKKSSKATKPQPSASSTTSQLSKSV